jgi:S-DNA-T family DNA segregation ATPase FtsK/SpoIIIE
MAKEKFNKKILENNNFECVMIGIMMILISLIGLIGKGPVGEFLQYCLLFLFGIYYILVYLFIIFLGVYLIVNKKFLKIKFNMYFVATILIFIILLSASNQVNETITLTNFAPLYLENLHSSDITLFNVEGLTAILHSGGGFFGFLLQGLMTTCFTFVGYLVALGLFGTIAIIILLKDPIIYLVKYFKSIKKNKVEEAKESIIKEEEKIQDDDSSTNDSSLELLEESDTKDDFEDNSFDVTKIDENNLTPVEEDLPVTKSQTVDIKMVNPTINVSYNTFKIDKVDSPEDIKPKKDNQIFESNTYDFTETQSSTNSIPKINSVERTIYKTQEVPVVTKETKEINNNVVVEHHYQKPHVEKVEVTPIEPVTQTPIIGDTTNRERPKDKEFVDEVPHKKSLNGYKYPPIAIFQDHINEDVTAENRILAENRLEKLNETFQEYKIGARCESYTIGPSVTRFNVRMNEGVKVGQLESIKNEIGLKLGGVKNVRLELVVEGKDTSSIELGNSKAESVSFKDCLNAIATRTKPKDKLLVPLGKGIDNNVETVNIDELPHLLVAGTTGSGKSVFINTIIASLLMRNRPDELKLMLIDPKQVEFVKYEGLPHLLCPIVTDARQGKVAFKKLVEEMERRYTLFREKGKGVTKISEFNALAPKLGLDPLPNIVVIVDEFSDFMSEYGKEIEPNVKRLCQKSRACGIYLIICTQRPSVNVVTGDIKAVVPSRIGLKLPSFTDSRTILDEGGAEQLIGYGDMLCKLPGHSSMIRVQGSYIPTEEIIDLIDFIKNEAEVEYDENFLNLDAQPDDNGNGNFMAGAQSLGGDNSDEFLDVAREHVLKTRIASTSNLQSRFGIGFPRADKLLMLLEDEGVVARNASGNRRIVKMTIAEWNATHPDKQINN